MEMGKGGDSFSPRRAKMFPKTLLVTVADKENDDDGTALIFRARRDESKNIFALPSSLETIKCLRSCSKD
jgi:hypothetical protein